MVALSWLAPAAGSARLMYLYISLQVPARLARRLVCLLAALCHLGFYEVKHGPCPICDFQAFLPVSLLQAMRCQRCCFGETNLMYREIFVFWCPLLNVWPFGTPLFALSPALCCRGGGLSPLRFLEQKSTWLTHHPTQYSSSPEKIFAWNGLCFSKSLLCGVRLVEGT